MHFPARTPDDLTAPEKIRSMSGLDFMKALQEGRLAGAPIAATLRYELLEVKKGRVVFSGVPGFDTLNPSGAVHGGWYGALLDSAMGCAAMTMVPQGSVYTTLEYKVNITRAIPQDMPVTCTATVDHAGRSTVVAHGEIRGSADDKLYATGSTTCIIMKTG